MDKYLYDAPDWAEFVLDSGYNSYYWGGHSGYSAVSNGKTSAPSQRWREATYQYWKKNPLTKVVVHQLEND